MSVVAVGREPESTSGHRDGRGIPSATLLMSLMIDEIFATASQDQAHGFFRAIGRRLSTLSPVVDREDIGVLAQVMNRLWTEIGWGHVTLQLKVDGIDIAHSGYPPQLTGSDPALWQKAAAAILEGAYDSWFRSVGGGSSLRTFVLSQSSDRIELRHGL